MQDQISNLADAPSVALPETRQLDILARMLESRDINVVRCPMVAILDAPDPAPVEAWIRRLIDSPPDLLIIYTGEGVYRLEGFARRAGVHAAFVKALKNTPLLTRGPKPVRALRALNVLPTWEADAPTTDGVIATLESMQLAGKRIAVQLYGADPNQKLMSWLSAHDIAPDCVAPYVYASESDDAEVGSLIRKMHGQEIDAIAFTSKAQFERLQRVAERLELSNVLDRALASVCVAAVGPVIARELEANGIRVDVVPQQNFHMKPLVRRLIERLAERASEQQTPA